MSSTKLFLAGTFVIVIGPVSQFTAQVQTQVPDVVSGAKPATVERIKIHGAALEGNLEIPPALQERTKR